MSNTGRKVYQFLKQVDADTLVPTGVRKANVIGDPDYVPPVGDFVTCPIIAWQATDPFCELDESSNNTGMKGYTNRVRLTNGSLDGYSELNTNGGGLGPYFAPVSDIISCPPPVPPPPPPSFNISIENHIGGMSLTGVSGIIYSPISGSFPTLGIALVRGLHGAAPTVTIVVTTSGTLPPIGSFNMRYRKNGVNLITTPAVSNGTYSFSIGSITAADIIVFDLTT